MLGIVDYDDLCKEVIGLPEFLKMIGSAVVDHGRACLNCPYGCLDFSWVYDSEEWSVLHQVCGELQDILDDIYEVE